MIKNKNTFLPTQIFSFFAENIFLTHIDLPFGSVCTYVLGNFKNYLFYFFVMKKYMLSLYSNFGPLDDEATTLPLS